MEPQIRFCTSADGTRIAYATMGDGPPLVFVPPWGGDMGRDWTYPDCRAALDRLTRGRLLVTFDRRGVGASQREADDFSFGAQVADVATVVEHLGLAELDLCGQLEGAAISVAYAAEHPERVRRLVLWAPYPTGVDIARPGATQALVDLIHANWGLARRAIASVVFPSGPSEWQRYFSEGLRQCISPDVAAKQIEFFATVDVRAILPLVKAPTLVFHRRGDRDAPISAGREVAALIPDSRFVALEGDIDHIFLGDTSYIEVMTQFLDEGRSVRRAAEGAPPVGLATILFTDIEGSTTLTQRLGDAKAQELLRTHNTIVRNALKSHHGSEVKHTGDGIMASFPSASQALQCAIAVQQAVEAQADMPLRVRVGLNAGEPIAEEQDLFGAAVQLARRVCDHADPAQILVSDVVRQLAMGKGFLFSDHGDVELRGFEDPVKLWEVRWQEDD